MVVKWMANFIDQVCHTYSVLICLETSQGELFNSRFELDSLNAHPTHTKWKGVNLSILTTLPNRSKSLILCFLKSYGSHFTIFEKINFNRLIPQNIINQTTKAQEIHHWQPPVDFFPVFTLGCDTALSFYSFMTLSNQTSKDNKVRNLCLTSILTQNRQLFKKKMEMFFGVR